MKRNYLIFIFIWVTISIMAQKNAPENSRSDTVDIIKYQINLDITDFKNKTIKGNCVVSFTPRINALNFLNLDLLMFKVDSITANGSKLNYSYNDTLLKITLPKTMTIGDTTSLRVYYGGTTNTDQNGYGGFFFDNYYAYNIGVGFYSNPHVIGRFWFPCIDNFVERSTYEFNIITSAGRKAHCNGRLVSEKIIAGDTIITNWKMDEEIPTYLACVAVSDYVTIGWTHKGINGPIPVVVAARAVDTANVRKSFVNVDTAISIYEKYYGPYMWNKVGYSVTSFTKGAMEHSTNITLPYYCVNGTLDGESTTVHELAHQWWGDLVTCETEGNMWINEGIAAYSEYLFYEHAYSFAKSQLSNKYNQKYILQYLHGDENGYKALYNMPHEYTYGAHIYQKGASVMHNMRTYMGDSLFFVGLKSIINKYKFKTINTYQFRDELKNATGIDMTNFFNDWIFSPGYSHFSIDSSASVVNGNNYDVTVYVKQKLKGATNYHTNVPIEISFYDSKWNKTTKTIIASGRNSKSTFTIPYNPILIILNEDNKLNQARTEDQMIIKSAITKNLDLSMFYLKVNSLKDSALIRIEHNWVAPDSIKNNSKKYRISKNRYWTIDGIFPAEFSTSIKLLFDARPETGFLDKDLIPNFADSMLLLYRKNAKSDWTEYPYYSIPIDVKSKTYGFANLTKLLPGEYAFAKGKSSIGVEENKMGNNLVRIYPNPSNDFIYIETITKSSVNIYNINGQIVKEFEISNPNNVININDLPKGYYTIEVVSNQNIYRSKLIKE